MFVHTLGISVCFVLGFVSTSAYAQNVGISKTAFMDHYREQGTTTWCWASSAEMVLSFQGVKIPQDAIVTRVKGAPIQGTADPVAMVAATNGVFDDESRKKIIISGQYVTGSPAPTVLYNQLKHNRPVVLTYQNGPWTGHAVVLTGMDAKATQDGVWINRFYVFDPFPYVQVMTPFGVRLVKDASLIYQQLDLIATPIGLQLSRAGMPIGVLSGMILMDATNL
ncbi:C39 family peptidase [Janthinobacterium sp. Mn2066]|uniref:C39 family peptidase n=1 Tax=Janthinobacterium sp. Mn2066 TaxID=3395264 RepID=UPI003BF4954F